MFIKPSSKHALKIAGKFLNELDWTWLPAFLFWNLNV